MWGQTRGLWGTPTACPASLQCVPSAHPGTTLGLLALLPPQPPPTAPPWPHGTTHRAEQPATSDSTC